ncbi:hypothetical protein OG693_39860 [Streptomyces sp. NBC_01259]|uniref:hypothetical protein n=1 Tax=Streptomyces sp. NBC_01259 TaxID=2903800 RepID=UPI00324532B0
MPGHAQRLTSPGGRSNRPPGRTRKAPPMERLMYALGIVGSFAALAFALYRATV